MTPHTPYASPIALLHPDFAAALLAEAVADEAYDAAYDEAFEIERDEAFERFNAPQWASWSETEWETWFDRFCAKQAKVRATAMAEKARDKARTARMAKADYAERRMQGVGA